MLIFEEGAFAFEVSCFEPAQPLTLCYGSQDVLYMIIWLDLSSLVIFVRRVDIRRICENRRYFAILQRSHRFGKAIFGFGDGTY